MEKNAFRDREDTFRVPESANRRYKNLCRGRVITAHNSPYSSFSSFLPVFLSAVQRVFDQNFAPVAPRDLPSLNELAYLTLRDSTCGGTSKTATVAVTTRGVSLLM
jgi:hypothetical protein